MGIELRVVLVLKMQFWMFEQTLKVFIYFVSGPGE